MTREKKRQRDRTAGVGDSDVDDCSTVLISRASKVVEDSSGGKRGDTRRKKKTHLLLRDAPYGEWEGWLTVNTKMVPYLISESVEVVCMRMLSLSWAYRMQRQWCKN